MAEMRLDLDFSPELEISLKGAVQHSRASIFRHPSFQSENAGLRRLILVTAGCPGPGS
jgi:hypothetical protein